MFRFELKDILEYIMTFMNEFSIIIIKNYFLILYIYLKKQMERQE
jgi:hypothetical protein